MSKSIVITAAAAALEPAPVLQDEVRNDTPRMRSRELSRSHDGTSHTMVWESTAGCFDWDYNKDETFVVISGEAFITSEKGEERLARDDDERLILVVVPVEASGSTFPDHRVRGAIVAPRQFSAPHSRGVVADLVL